MRALRLLSAPEYLRQTGRDLLGDGLLRLFRRFIVGGQYFDALLLDEAVIGMSRQDAHTAPGAGINHVQRRTDGLIGGIDGDKKILVYMNKWTGQLIAKHGFIDPVRHIVCLH